MFGLRYHVASLAAVFVALAVGILLGVAVSGKVTDAGEDIELQNLKDDNENLQSELEAARAAEQAATERGEGAEELLASPSSSSGPPTAACARTWRARWPTPTRARRPAWSRSTSPSTPPS
jgi:type II secretory pathway pseudopilin PulG